MTISDFVKPMKDFLNNHPDNRIEFIKIMMNMDAVKQMFQFLYFDSRKTELLKSDCYSLFFESSTISSDVFAMVAL